MLTKHSPLQDIYPQYAAQTTLVEGWSIAAHFGQPQQEVQHGQAGALLADWSHISKVSISGVAAAAHMECHYLGAGAIAPLTAYHTPTAAILRLTANDYMVLSDAGAEAHLLDSLTAPNLTVINQTGALGCFVLAGSQRDQVLERSTAMNLRRDTVLPGSVLQTTLHTMRCTLYRTPDWEMILHPRSLSVSLFEALIDVGIGVGLRPTGIAVLPVMFDV